jgi:fumarylpyruvate hydrolase
MNLIFEAPPPILAPTSVGEQFPVRRVFCIGRNYAAHAREMGRDPNRERPFFFTAWSETVVPDGTTISYPTMTHNFQYEAELVVAIGKSGRHIPVEQAQSYAWGYACGLDMTRRDLQLEARDAGRPWDSGKNVEQSSPLGLIRKADARFDPNRGAIGLSVNGVTKQQADLGDMIWPVPDIVSYLSQFYRLEPGDLIYTGTPAGVGAVVEGDSVTVTIEGLEPLNIRIGPQAP